MGVGFFYERVFSTTKHIAQDDYNARRNPL